jgi:hypothetical protein
MRFLPYPSISEVQTMKRGFPVIVLCLFGMFLALAGLSGCAAVDQLVTLNYSPINQGFGQHNEAVVVSKTDSAPFVKNSRGEWIVGSINNVHGVHMADLLADHNQGEWIADALLLELKHAGYSATYKTPLPPGTAFGIQLSNINAFMNMNKGIFKTDIKQELRFNVDFFLNGSRVKSFTVASRTNQTVAFNASEDENAAIMLQGLQDAMQQVMTEVQNQMHTK